MDKLQISQNKTIYEALVRLNSIEEDISRLILFVVNEKGEVIGSLTDGDIRRELIKNKDLNQIVDQVCNKNFTYITQSNSFVKMGDYRKRNIKMLPVLDQNKRLVKIVNLEKVKSILPMECMIMAGGRGKRLSPLTDDVPKPMLLLGDMPIIEHNIQRLISFGIEKFYISVKYLGDQIVNYFGDGSSRGISIEYIWEDEPLGTAGALSLVKDFQTDHILLINSDVFTNIDFEDLYLEMLDSKAEMAVASTEYKVDIPYAVFETSGNMVKKFKEKPSYIYQSNAGIYILNRSLIDEIPKNKFYDITDLMDKIVDEERKLVYNPIVGYWIDIGKPSDYEYAQNFIKHLEH
jgi:dTDP-glucose pyrophosphorylase